MKSIQQYLFEVSDATLKSAIAKADAKINDPDTERHVRINLKRQKEEFEKYLRSDKHKRLVKIEEILKQGTFKPKNKKDLIAVIIAFLEYGRTNLNFIDVSGIEDFQSCFGTVDDYVKVKDIDISEWDMSNARSTAYMFYGCDEFNADLSKWDMHNVKTMKGMFSRCKSFNSDLSKWDVSNCTNMSQLFLYCRSFNSDLSKWNVSKCSNMIQMFSGCESFNSDLSKWDVSKCEDMVEMFGGCKSFNSDLSKWDVSSCAYFDNMFYLCKNFNADLSRWDVEKGSKISNMTSSPIDFAIGSKIENAKNKLPRFND